MGQGLGMYCWEPPRRMKPAGMLYTQPLGMQKGKPLGPRYSGEGGNVGVYRPEMHGGLNIRLRFHDRVQSHESQSYSGLIIIMSYYGYDP